MDYQVSLKNIILDENKRVEIEQRLFELKEIASTYFKISAKLEFYENLFYCEFILKRDNSILSSKKTNSNSLNEAMDLAKEDLNNQIMAEFVRSAA